LVRPPAEDERRPQHVILVGEYVDLAHFSADDVSLDDICHHLARICRFNGATRGPLPYPVAQHSVLVGELVRTSAGIEKIGAGWAYRLRALLHDAHEAYIGDITYPVSRVLCGAAIAELKAAIQGPILEHFGLSSLPISGELEDRIKSADMAALALERRHFLHPQVFHDRWCEHEAFPGMTYGFHFNPVIWSTEAAGGFLRQQIESAHREFYGSE
jgi:hypothetical protein